MKLCSRCLRRADLRVPQPQLLKSIKWCDHCHEPKSSYNVMEVVEQLLVVQVRED